MIVAGSRNFLGAAYLAATVRDPRRRRTRDNSHPRKPHPLRRLQSYRAHLPAPARIRPRNSRQQRRPTHPRLPARLQRPARRLRTRTGSKDPKNSRRASALGRLASANRSGCRRPQHPRPEIPDWWKLWPADAILTPHPGEMSRLTGASARSDRLEIAQQSAYTWNKTVILKGAYTVVAAPNSNTMLSPILQPRARHRRHRRRPRGRDSRTALTRRVSCRCRLSRRVPAR